MFFLVSIPDAVLSDVSTLELQVADIVEFVARQNRYLMRRLGRRIPPLYDSGVVYRDDAVSLQHLPQHFPHCLEVLQRRHANCRGLVPYKLAELRQERPDLQFSVHAYTRKRGARGGEIHVQILMPDGQIEDPSRFLGMT